jgi:hypothetical protein
MQLMPVGVFRLSGVLYTEYLIAKSWTDKKNYQAYFEKIFPGAKRWETQTGHTSYSLLCNVFMRAELTAATSGKCRWSG